MAKKTVTTEDSIEMQARALQEMSLTQGWGIMVKMMQKNIDFLAECIISKEQHGEKLDDLQVDRLRDKHSFLKELMNMPHKFAEKLLQKAPDEEEFDPYYKEAKDLINDRKRKKK